MIDGIPKAPASAGTAVRNGVIFSSPPERSTSSKLSCHGECCHLRDLFGQNRPLVLQIPLGIGFDCERERAFRSQDPKAWLRDEIALEVLIVAASVDPHIARAKPVPEFRQGAERIGATVDFSLFEDEGTPRSADEPGRRFVRQGALARAVHVADDGKCSEEAIDGAAASKLDGFQQCRGKYPNDPAHVDQLCPIVGRLGPRQALSLGHAAQKLLPADPAFDGGEGIGFPLPRVDHCPTRGSERPQIVTYADDLVILCRRGNAEAALHRLREIMGKLKLTVNEDKTQICKVPEGEFDFLGFSVLQAHTERSSSWTDQRVDKLRER